jgi:hypothetical protein
LTSSPASETFPPGGGNELSFKGTRDTGSERGELRDGIVVRRPEGQVPTPEAVLALERIKDFLYRERRIDPSVNFDPYIEGLDFVSSLAG